MNNNEITKLHYENQALKSENDQLKAQHDDLVSRNALLRQRPDLPVDRIPAHERLVRLNEENNQLKAQVERLRGFWKMLEHLSSVCKGTIDLCEPKKQSSYDDPTEHYGGQALHELSELISSELPLLIQVMKETSAQSLAEIQAEVLEQKAASIKEAAEAIPLGHEILSRGKSTYNWHMSFVKELNEEANRIREESKK